MKKFLFLIAMLCAIAGLMAGTAQAVDGRYSGNLNNNQTNHSRAVFYTEDFESGATGWTHYDGAITPNNWHIYAYGAPQANVWWMGDPALAVTPYIGGYHNHQYLVLDTPVSTITTANSTLTFKMRHGLEDPGASGGYNGWDSFNIRVSTNSGVTYTVIPATVIAPTYDFTDSYAFGSEFGEGLGVPGWGGHRDTWTTVTVNLASYLVSGTANVKIRFAFAADPSYSTIDDPSLYGVMVDDIAFGSYTNAGVADGQMTFTSMVPTAGDFWHVATDTSAPSPTHIMTSINSAGTYVNNMLNYLESPSIVLPTGATQIVADFQLKGTYSDPGTFPDVDYFGWEIYHGGAWHYMSNPYADPDLSNYVFSSAPDTWASMINSYTGVDGDITDFAGDTVKFRWYFESNATTPSGTPLMIDDFQIFSVTAAPAPVNLVYPVNGALGLPYTGFNLDWSPSSLGATPEYYTVYMSHTESDLPSSAEFVSDNLTLSYFNPVTTGGLTFVSNERWYWQVGASIVGQEDALSDIYRFDTVNSANVISTFPWNEGFEGTTFPPTNWTRATVDNDATNWLQFTGATYIHSGTKSAYHAYATTTPDPGQNDWLITPPIQLPTTGSAIFSFWNYNRYPPATVNAVLINSNNDPNDPFWVTLWSQDETASAWAQEMINLATYSGQIIYLAFNYQGYDMNNWYIDDLNLTVYTSDILPPTIKHLPVLNTPREDLSNLVYADIADDAAFNNPIGGAYVYYSTDGGTNWSAPISMVLDVAPTYVGQIPAQALGTTVTYKISAWDSLNNSTVTANYSFMVADPVWVRYFTAGTTYTGYSVIFGPTVLYDNPFYGTTNAMKLNSVSGRSYYATTANIHVYAYDGASLVNLITPVPVSFVAQTTLTTDLSALNIQITTPYFLVAYEDIPAGNYFYFSGTYNYGTSYVKQGTTLYTMSSAGSWCISAYVATGAIIPGAPAITIGAVAGVPTISWPADPNADYYKVYGTNDPYAAVPVWTLLGSPVTNSFPYTGGEAFKFFKVYSFNARGVNGTVSNLPVATGGIAEEARFIKE